MNGHAEKLFGYAFGSLTGLGIETLIPERVRQRHHGLRATYMGTPNQVHGGGAAPHRSSARWK